MAETFKLNSKGMCCRMDIFSRPEDISDSFDTLVIVCQDPTTLPKDFSEFQDSINQVMKVDAHAKSSVFVVPVAKANPIKRLVVSPTGPLNRDYDDSRRLWDAAGVAIKRAIQAGAKGIVFSICLFEKTKQRERYAQADLVTLLGGMYALYVPLEVREAVGHDATKVDHFAYYTQDASKAEHLRHLTHAFEAGRIVTRDIQGSDPERMAPPRVAEYVKERFAGTSIDVKILSDQDQLAKEYPCMGAVNRAASSVPRHQGRVIYLEYKGQGAPEETVMLVGKGICYDTGGADIKAGGVMAGMHRDKGGAAGIAGFFMTLHHLQPRNVHAIGALAMIRNSVGEECYVADEIITSRSGKRVRVGNTDAEGRMAMTDLLCHLKERAIKEKLVSPQLYTVATLTGHAVIAYKNYTAALDNGPAQQRQNSQKLQAAGDIYAEPVEISTIRREDYDFHRGPSEYEDVLQCNNAPSSRTPRGHQTPSAFLIMSSGMDKHGIDSDHPLPYTHLDIAGSEGPFPGVPLGTPIMALTGRHVMHHL